MYATSDMGRVAGDNLSASPSCLSGGSISSSWMASGCGTSPERLRLRRRRLRNESPRSGGVGGRGLCEYGRLAGQLDAGAMLVQLTLRRARDLAARGPVHVDWRGSSFAVTSVKRSSSSRGLLGLEMPVGGRGWGPEQA